MNWTLDKIAAGIAAVGLLAAFGGNAQAACNSPPGAGGDCIYINLTGTKASPNGVTDVFDNLGFTNTLGTSFYTPGLAVGSAVYDTNIATQLQAYGITAGSNSYTAANGTSTVSLNGSPSRAQRNIDSLGTLDNIDDDVEGFESGGGWSMLVEYELFGSVISSPVGPIADYTSGYFNLRYDDFSNNANDTQILRANVQSSQLLGSALEIIGTVSYDFDGNGSDDCTAGSLCAQFFNFASPDAPFFPIQAGTLIRFTLDTTVLPPSPTLAQLGVTTAGANTYWVRQTGLDGRVLFEQREIPEPTTLALLGAGLIGAARMRRRKA